MIVAFSIAGIRRHFCYILGTVRCFGSCRSSLDTCHRFRRTQLNEAHHCATHRRDPERVHGYFDRGMPFTSAVKLSERSRTIRCVGGPLQARHRDSLAGELT